MRRLTPFSRGPSPIPRDKRHSADRRRVQIIDAVGVDPDEADGPLDILVMHGGALRRPWLRVQLDPATGAVLGLDAVVLR